ncbi:MAG: hypothetical protein KDD35_04985 [Bdellovibrionales bacterium]|nr:hypothetical protein [Bdellovibrionales bacterium]
MDHKDSRDLTQDKVSKGLSWKSIKSKALYSILPIALFGSLSFFYSNCSGFKVGHSDLLGVDGLPLDGEEGSQSFGTSTGDGYDISISFSPSRIRVGKPTVFSYNVSYGRNGNGNIVSDLKLDCGGALPQLKLEVRCSYMLEGVCESYSGQDRITLKDLSQGTYVCKVMNATAELRVLPADPAPSNPNPNPDPNSNPDPALSGPPKGNLDKINMVKNNQFAYGGVYGWAFDPKDPSQSILVELSVQTQYGANCSGVPVPASYTRTDVNDAFKIGGNHGFYLNVFDLGACNSYLQRGGTHQLQVKAVGLDGQRYLIADASFTTPAPTNPNTGNFSQHAEVRWDKGGGGSQWTHSVDVRSSDLQTFVFDITSSSYNTALIPNNLSSSRTGLHLSEPRNNVVLGTELRTAVSSRLKAQVTVYANFTKSNRAWNITFYHRVAWETAVGSGQFGEQTPPGDSTGRTILISLP